MQALLWSTPTTTTLRAQSNLSRLTEKFKTLLSKQEETDKSVGKEEEECLTMNRHFSPLFLNMLMRWLQCDQI